MKLNSTNFLSFTYAHAIPFFHESKDFTRGGGWGEGWGTQQIFIREGSTPLNPFLSEKLDQLLGFRETAHLPLP